MGEGIHFVTPEEAKTSTALKLLYLACSIANMANILFDFILIKATIRNK
jgi:hypothetical protein